MPEPKPPAEVAANPLATLLATLRRSELLGPAAMTEVEARPEAHGNDVKALGRYLFQQGYLTRYQLNQCAAGRDDDLVLGPYVLLDRIAEGGGGQVYKARHRVMNRIVALKRIRPEKLGKPELVQRFFQEAQVAAQVDHPNVVRAFDAGQVGTSCYLVMEFVDGMDLTRLVKEAGPLSVATACEFIRQAAAGLQHAHERGLIHRDIKPSNLLVAPVIRSGGGTGPPVPGPDAVVKVLDLGLARWHVGDQDAARGPGMGSPPFVAPEQAKSADAADARSDLYSLGCTFFYLLTGRGPFEGATHAELLQGHLSKEPPRVESVRANVPATLGDVIARLLCKNPAERYQSAAEVAAVVGKVAAALTSERPALDPPPAAALAFTDAAADTADAEDVGTLSIFTTSPVSPAYKLRRPARGKKTVALAFGVGLHVLAVVIVVGVLVWKHNRPEVSANTANDVRISDDHPTSSERQPTTAGNNKAKPVASIESNPPDQPNDPSAEPNKAKTKNKNKAKNKAADPPAPVRFVKGTAPAGKEPIVVDNLLPSVTRAEQPFAPGRIEQMADSDLGPIRCMAIGPGRDGKLIVGDTRLHIVNSANGKTIKTLIGAGTESFEVNPNEVLGVGITAGKLMLRSIDPSGPPQPFVGDRGRNTCATHSPNGEYVLSGSEDGIARLWSLLSRDTIRALPVGDAVTAIAVARNGWLAAVGTRGGQVSFWDLESGQLLRAESKHTLAVRGMAITTDGEDLLSAGEDGKVHIWSLQDGTLKATLRFANPGLVSIATVCPGQAIAGSSDGKLHVIDLRGNQTIVFGDERTGPFIAAVVAPDGKSVIAAFRQFGLARLDLTAGGTPLPPAERPKNGTP